MPIWILSIVLLAAAAGREAVITFHIAPPPGTPPGDTLWVSGNVPELGSWNGRGVAAWGEADGGFTASVRLPEGTAIEWKITRGSWATVEKGPQGEEISNRRHRVDGSDTLEVRVASWRAEAARPSTRTGDLRLHESVASTHLRHPRNVLVYLPPGYDAEPERRYPVLYMHDGQNLFDAATAFVGVEWGVDETAGRLIAEGVIEPLIVVGIYNSPDRMDEYTPVPNGSRGGGRAEDYATFLTEELLPFVNRTYRTLPDREHTGVAGSSLGGLVSMYLALGDRFSRIGVVSPAVWWGDGDILRRVRAAEREECLIWLDIGTAEGEEAVTEARALRDALVERGWVLGKDLTYVEEPRAPHNETAWAGRLGAMFTFLFPRRD